MLVLFVGQQWVGDPRFDEYFSFLLEAGIPIYPLPYFPAPRLITEAKIFDEEKSKQSRSPIVAYAGSLWGHRQKYLSSLTAVIPDAVRIRQGLSATEYLTFLKGALIALDFAGSETATYRFSETLLSGAACVCQQRPFFVLPPCPVSGNELVLFDSEQELIELARELLSDPDAALSIGAAGRFWYKTTHTPEKYLRYLLQIAMGERSTVQLPIAQNGFWSSWS